MSYRIVRWEDVYLTDFDEHHQPVWGPRDDAGEYPTKEAAHEACRKARREEGLRRGTVCVLRVPALRRGAAGGKP